MNRTTFFAYARRAPFGGRLSQDQVDGCLRLLSACDRAGVTDDRQRAYVLASVFHETGGRMQPVRETFAASDAQAQSRLEAAWRSGKLKISKPYWRDGWFGRGDIQITWRDNYLKLGNAVGADLVGRPGLALDPVVSARVAVIGMRDGLFTGKRLADFFGIGKDDPVGARRIVNGTDKAKLIAGYHKNFLDALEAAEDAELPSDVMVEAAKPDDVKPSESGGVWAAASSFATGATALPFLANVGNAWSLAALALILIAGGIGAWLVLSGRVTINRRPA